MVAIATDKGVFSQTGVGVWDYGRMKHAKPDEYIVAHVLGDSSRAWRRRMYFCMLKQALWAQNDKLAAFALGKCLMYVKKQRETLREAPDGILEPGWNREKELRYNVLMYRVLKLCRWVIGNKRLYELDYEESDHWRKAYKIALPETWKLAVGEVVGILGKHSESGHWKIPVDDRLVKEAYDLICSVFTAEICKDALGFQRNDFSANFPREDKAILEMMKYRINLMKIEQIIYFLEKYPRMYRDMLHLFRIEYARKGGVFDLKAPPIKE